MDISLGSDKLTDLVSNHASAFNLVTRANAYQVFWALRFLLQMCIKKPQLLSNKRKKKGDEWKLKTPIPFFCALPQLGTIQPTEREFHGGSTWKHLFSERGLHRRKHTMAMF